MKNLRPPLHVSAVDLLSPCIMTKYCKLCMPNMKKVVKQVTWLVVTEVRSQSFRLVTERHHYNARAVAMRFHRRVWHHPHPLGYLCAKFRFWCSLDCWAKPWRKIAYSITRSLSLFNVTGTEAFAFITMSSVAGALSRDSHQDSQTLTTHWLNRRYAHRIDVLIRH